MFKRGSLVWGKLNSYPWWPAIIISPEDCGRDKDEDDSKVWLFWFGDKKISQVKTENIIDFEMHFKDKSSKSKGKQMEKAIRDILLVCGKRHNVITSYTHSSDLLAWANSGFKGSTVLTDKEYDELPDMVLKSLEEKNFQRNTETSESDTDSESDVINEVVLKVHKGVQKLEEICIICCKSRTVITKEHPYFIGGICKNCEVNMKNLSKFVFGKLQDICVICAQGGNLVYCCNDLCSSSYCDLCIDYLVGNKSFKQITNNENWKCYLCEPVSNKECLIKRRFKFESKEICAQSFPEEKKPVRVIAQSDAARKLLEKNIEVELYCYEPLNVQSSTIKYQDFTKEQFSEIKADLVYGSYFVSTIVPIDSKKEMLAFSTEFFKFLFRLDNAKFFKPLVFFILVSDVELNVQMHKRVIRFLEVEPVTYKIDHRSIYVWTNIPDLSQQDSKILELEIVENHTAEEEIISKYGKTLKYYFKNAS